jgi:hypothetical protein
MQATILREFYRPDKQYSHLVLVCGMRSGKTQLGAMATSYELFKLIMLGDPQKHYGLPPGQPIFILHVANSRDQAFDTIYAQTAGLLGQSDWFADHGLEEKHMEFVFPQYHLHLRCDHSNSASLAGRTAKAVVLDETARFKDNQGKFSGEAVYYTVSRAVKTFGLEGKVFSVSSPIYEDDFQMRLYRQGKKLDNFLTYQLPTWEMNPRITRKLLDAEFKLNPETAWRDYGAKPPAAIEAFFRDRVSVGMAFDENLPQLIYNDRVILEAMPERNTNYYLAGDPAVKNDAFGLAMVHSFGDMVITDFTHRFMQTEEEPEINAEKVKSFILDIANRFPIRSFLIDTWQYPETIQAINSAGIFVKQHTVKKQEYDCLKERIYTGKIKIPVNEKLKDELLQLEMVHGIRVDHPRNGSKDMADALANAVFECVGEEQIRPEVWRPTNINVSPSTREDSVYILPPISEIDEREFDEIPL